MPIALRRRLGIHAGTRIEFSLFSNGGFQADEVLYSLEDLRKMTDQGGQSMKAMTFQEMDQAKARRKW